MAQRLFKCTFTSTKPYVTRTTHHYSMPLRFITSRHCHIFQHKILPQITPHCYHTTTATTHHPTLPSRNATIQFRYDSLPFSAFTFLLARSLSQHYSSFPLQNPISHHLDATQLFTSATIHYPSLPPHLFLYKTLPFITLTLHHNSLPLLSILFYLPHKGTPKIRSAIHKHTHLWTFPYNHFSVFTNGYLTYPTHHVT